MSGDLISPFRNLNLTPSKTYYFPVEAVNESCEVELPVGFAKPKEYYNPKYPPIQTSSFKNHAAIWWEPNIIIKPNANYEFLVDNLKVQSFSIFYEGINELGKTIVNKQQINLKQNNKL